MNQQPRFLQRLSVGNDADERSIRRAYARELKQIDQEADPAGFQSLREAYEAALTWLRHRAPAQEAALVSEPASEPAAAEAKVSYAPAGAGVATAAPTLSKSAPGSGPAEAREQPVIDEQTLAGTVFADFLQHCAEMHKEFTITDDAPWQRELRRSLADPRLIGIQARQIFEWRVASLLVEGWRAGHQDLLAAAAAVFGWAKDRRRVQALGRAGMVLDRALEQHAMFDMQAWQEQQHQLKLLERLRSASPPTARELVRDSARLEFVLSRFPAWASLMTSVENINQWREMNANLPQWRRRLLTMGVSVTVQTPQGQRKSISIHWIWIILVVAMLIARPGSSPSVQAPVRDNPAVIFSTGVAARGAMQYQEALAAFTRVIQLDPASAAAYLQRALTYEGDGQPEMALQDAAQSIRLAPTSFGAYVLRARVFLALGQFDKATAEADALLRVLPKRADAYLVAAYTYSRAHQDKEALAILERGMEKVPNQAAFYAHHSTYRPGKDIVGRRKDLSQAFEIDPKDFYTSALEGDLELNNRNYPAAISHYSYALDYGRPDPGLLVGVLVARGIALTRDGKEAAATSDFEQAAKKSKTAADLNSICRNLAVNNIALPFALTNCDAALKKRPADADALDNRGLVLLRLKRYPESIAAYNAALKAHPEQARSLFGRGVAKLRAGEAREGMADINAAGRLDAGIAGQYASYGVRP